MRIGNSQAVPIPKRFLQQTPLREDIEIEVQNHEIVIRPAERPRQGWAEAFRAMAARKDDRLLDMEPSGFRVVDDS
jgi:antitoxin MazE